MMRSSARRIFASLLLGVFLPTAALSSTLHACCMELSAGSLSTASAVTDHGTHGGHGPHAAPASQDLRSDHAEDRDADHHEAHQGNPGHEARGHEDPGSHAAHAADSGDSDSSGVCCCAVCDCMAAGVGPVAAFAESAIDTPAASARSIAVSSLRHTSPVAFLLPYPNGPPEATV